MPHAVFNLGVQSGSGNFRARSLIPGVEPGGSRVGQPTKPALLIRDAYCEIQDYTMLGATDFNGFRVYLKLSQELDMTPGLILPVAVIGAELDEADATGQNVLGTQQIHDHIFRAQGTIWAPRMVAIRLEERGTAVLDVDVHLDYEQVDVPWMDWFIMWEFLDGIADNERQY